MGDYIEAMGAKFGLMARMGINELEFDALIAETRKCQNPAGLANTVIEAFDAGEKEVPIYIATLLARQVIGLLDTVQRLMRE